MTGNRSAVPGTPGMGVHGEVLPVEGLTGAGELCSVSSTTLPVARLAGRDSMAVASGASSGSAGAGVTGVLKANGDTSSSRLVPISTGVQTCAGKLGLSEAVVAVDGGKFSNAGLDIVRT